VEENASLGWRGLGSLGVYSDDAMENLAVRSNLDLIGNWENHSKIEAE